MSPLAPSVGQVLGHYRIVEQIGAGGMGVVYRAHDEQLERDVAVKVLPPGRLANEATRKQFRKEALALAKLDHPNVATVYEFGDDHGVDFLVTAYIPGITLDAKLASGALPQPEVVSLGIELAQGLAAAHEKGIIHRDLKPGNLRLTPEGRLKILDFGLAQLVEPEGEVTLTASLAQSQEVVAGTLPYMAPEQLRGEKADACSDIWAAGAVLYETATAHRPFEEKVSTALAGDIIHKAPPPPRTLKSELAPKLEAVILKCLEKNPANRYQSAKELAADLRHLQSPSTAAAVTVPLRLAITISGAVILSVLVLLLALNVGRWRERLTGRAGPERIQSLAVLPFENLSGDLSQRYLAAGITYSLTNQLAQISALRVISYTSTMAYEDSKQPLPEIARDLKVDAVVEGAVTRSGDRVRIDAQLIDASTGRQLWAKDYQLELSNSVAVEGEFARGIADKLQVKLTPQEQARLVRIPTVDAAAYDYYLKARSHLWLENSKDNDAAIELLEKAIGLDPNFAVARTGLARAYRNRTSLFDPRDTQWEDKAHFEVEKALGLDPDLAEAHLERGYLIWTLSNHFPHESAVREIRRALVLNPNLAEAHHQLANIFNHIGLLDKAQDEVHTAVAFDPENTGARFRTAVNLLYGGKYQEALAAFGGSQRFMPILWGTQTSYALFQLGRREEAAARVEEFLTKYPDDGGGNLTAMQALLAAAAGDRIIAEQKIRHAIQIGKGYQHFHHTAYVIGSAYALMNEPEPALRFLRQAAEEGFPCYPLFETDPNLNNLRSDPHFVQFIADLKKQWEYYGAKL
jgi:serine/threonine protein kinase